LEIARNFERYLEKEKQKERKEKKRDLLVWFLLEENVLYLYQLKDHHHLRILV